MRGLFAVERLSKIFALGHGQMLRAVDDVSLHVAEGESLAIVGESGCGKSTLARCMLRLLEPTSGAIFLNGQAVSTSHRLREFRRTVQIVFQNPLSSLDSRQRIGSIVAEPLVVNRVGDSQARSARVAQLLEQVGLSASDVSKYPHSFSGGQLQRVAIARALALGPRLLVCDEAVSALDVSIQAQVLQLLRDLQNNQALTFVFITHNLAIVPYVAQRVAVMYLGRIVEIGPVDEVFTKPQHPYTEALLDSVLSAHPSLENTRPIRQLTGEVPAATDIPAGCRFHPRCPRAQSGCRETQPELDETLGGQQAACFFPAGLVSPKNHNAPPYDGTGKPAPADRLIDQCR